MPGPKDEFRFEVAFSFAGAHRDKVRAIAELVAEKIDSGLQDRSQGRVFFDEWFEHEILGDDMDTLLQRFYHEKSRMVVADLSDAYAGRPWCQAEARAIRALRFELDPARDETGRLRLLNARFGDGNVPGVFKTTAYLDGIGKTAVQCADVILKRRELLLERTNGSSASIATSLASNPAAVVQNPSLSLPTPLISFFHPATNDTLYSRRENELAWLDDCTKDANIRIVTVTGVGGLGKTSLVGHWIAVRNGWQHRAFRGVFFYSFYSDRDADHFFVAFVQFAREVLNIQSPLRNDPLHHAAATLAQRWPFLIVLDGLEVLQADAEDLRYGRIDDGELNEFVSRLGEKGGSLLVLTSRFPFPELVRQFSNHCSSLGLPMFSPEEGADLLKNCGLPESREDLMAYSGQFGGHPLALRLFAGASTAAPATPPAELSREVLRAERVSTLPDPAEPGISDAERQRRRQRRQFQKLLEWLQAKLSPPKRRLLQLVALFREPVPTSTLAALATGLDAMKPDFEGCDPAQIRYLLDALACEYLLQREKEVASDSVRWSAHPIVRDLFRDAVLQSGGTIASQFAEIVAGKHQTRPRSVAELQPILEAIEVLLAAGDLQLANVLYRGRLEDGEVFKWIPAPQEGLRCARGFLESEERRLALVEGLGEERFNFYQNEVAFLGANLGEMDAVEQQYSELAKVNHFKQSWSNLSRTLQNLSEAQIMLGKLREVMSTANEALFYAGGVKMIDEGACQQAFLCRPATAPPDAENEVRDALIYRADALSLIGRLSSASSDFATAVSLERKKHLVDAPLYSLRGLRWCRHRLRLGESNAARHLTSGNRSACEWHERNDDLARCHLLLGQVKLSTDIVAASRWIGAAVRIFREGRLGMELPNALLAQSQLRRNEKDHEAALVDCEEALRLAARSRFALVECDGLNLRSLLRREAGELPKAMEDAREALTIAERCGYYWGRHEALRQLRDTAKTHGYRADARHWDEAEKELAAKMKPEIEHALRINRQHDEAMGRSFKG